MITCRMVRGDVGDIDESVTRRIQSMEAEGWEFHTLSMSEGESYNMRSVLVVFRKV